MLLSKKYRRAMPSSVQQGDQPGVNGRVAVGRIEQVPVARGQLGQERQAEVSHPPHQGHGAELPGVEIAVSLGVVGPTAHGWGRSRPADSEGPFARRVHFHHDLGAQAVGLVVAGQHGPADPLIHLLPQQPDARIAPGLLLDDRCRCGPDSRRRPQ